MTEYQKQTPQFDYIEIRIEAPREQEDILTTLLFEQGAAGVEIDDPAVIMQHLESNDWDASVFDGREFDTARIKLRSLLPGDEAGHKAAAGIVDAVKTMAGVVISSAVVPPVDWQNKWKEGFTSKPIGQHLWLRSYWDEAPVPKGRSTVTVSPGMAFGTGDHATTEMVLEWLDKYLQPGESVLDLGCGSGILGIAALKLGASHVVGVDIDEVCVNAVREHWRINNIVGTQFAFYLGDVLHDEKLQHVLRQEQAGLVVANITADVLTELADSVSGLLIPGGRFICSGILDRYDDTVAQALDKAGMIVKDRRKMGEWVSYVAFIRDE